MKSPRNIKPNEVVPYTLREEADILAAYDRIGGASFQEVADILGNTEAVVREHYGQWSKKRQTNIDRLMIAHFETAEVQEKLHMRHTKILEL